MAAEADSCQRRGRCAAPALRLTWGRNQRRVDRCGRSRLSPNRPAPRALCSCFGAVSAARGVSLSDHTGDGELRAGREAPIAHSGAGTPRGHGLARLSLPGLPVTPSPTRRPTSSQPLPNGNSLDAFSYYKELGQLEEKVKREKITAKKIKTNYSASSH